MLDSFNEEKGVKDGTTVVEVSLVVYFHISVDTSANMKAEAENMCVKLFQFFWFL